MRSAVLRRHPAAVLLPILLLAVPAVAGCGDRSGSPPAASTGGAATSAGAVTVHIRNFTFQPATLSVARGTTVTWADDDASTHTATADGQQWDTGSISTGAHGGHTFTTPGTFAYHCAIHQYMTATITVT